MGVHGRPPGAAFGLDKRTVASMSSSGRARSASGSTRIWCPAGQLDLQHVQADEIYVNVRTPPHGAEAGPEEQNTPAAPLPPSAGKGRVGQAIAVAVPARLWLSPHDHAHLWRYHTYVERQKSEDS